MNVELRLRVDHAPNCNCGVPLPAGVQPTCHHQLESDLGVIGNSEADPKRGLQPLMLTTWGYVGKLLSDGPVDGPRGGLHSASTTLDGYIDAGDAEIRVFAHFDYAGGRTTWELHDAHFADYDGPDDLVIGKWPD